MTTSPPQSPGTLDWNVGSYERTADQLLPAARVVVEEAAIAEGDRVLDIGCGTGNAALEAAARGAHATGVDPAPRLLVVARERAAAANLTATFLAGDAGALPIEDGAADVVVSVFGVIFAPDEKAAAAEMARVTAPGGRIVLSAWIPEGANSRAVRVAREAIGRAVGAPAGGPPFSWQNPDALSGLLGPHGFEVSLTEHRLSFTGESAAEYVDAEFRNHPLWVAGRAILEPRGEADTVRNEVVGVFEAANEDPDAFRVTSRYVVATARRVS